MDTTEHSPADEASEERRTIELQHLYDERSDPSTLTIFSPDPRRLSTEWVTADATAAVALDEHR